MKTISFTILLMISGFYSYAESMTEYKASNGRTYHVGDTIILGYGSMPNGDFKFLQMAGYGAALAYNSNGGSDQFNIGKGYAGYPLIVKKIKSVTTRGITKVYFVVGGGNITNYNLMIEDAIAFCEVADCPDRKEKQVENNDVSKYDELSKLKLLLDNGTITKEEFDLEKQKILSDKD